MIMQQKMHRPYPRNLKPVNRLALVLVLTKKLLHTLNRHKRAQPIPLVVVAHEEAAVAV
jgi:hypothetical protein